ncbi:uncharacterized protein G2W53_009721 [Senna tora]|uniref:Uncharacterized protein n=1 Tax=Senna tora TaxID=362788 RepID=A0A834WYH5_9FABA|nr:uncharacterized protein G2W53_009721 [Senna tora]
MTESQETLQDPSPPLSAEEADNLHRSCKKIKTNEEEGLIEDLTMDECPPNNNTDAPLKGVIEQIQGLEEEDESMPDLVISESPDPDKVKKALWQKDKPNSQTYMEKLLGINGRGNEIPCDDDQDFSWDDIERKGPTNPSRFSKNSGGNEKPSGSNQQANIFALISDIESEGPPSSEVILIQDAKDSQAENKQANASISQSHPAAENKTLVQKNKPKKADPIFALSKKQGPNTQPIASTKKPQKLPSDRHSDHMVVSSQAQGTKNLTLHNNIKSPFKLKEGPFKNLMVNSSDPPKAKQKKPPDYMKRFIL